VPFITKDEKVILAGGTGEPFPLQGVWRLGGGFRREGYRPPYFRIIRSGSGRIQDADDFSEESLILFFLFIFCWETGLMTGISRQRNGAHITGKWI